MLKQMTWLLMLAGVSACASQDRLMDADVRPGDLHECTVGDEPVDGKDKDRMVSPSPKQRRCHPDQGLKWSSGQSRDKPMEVDFRKK